MRGRTHHERLTVVLPAHTKYSSSAPPVAVPERTYTCHAIIELDDILQELGSRAVGRHTGKATAMGGRIVVRVIK